MKRLLKTFEVAEMLGREPRWVLEQAAAGVIPSFKVGKAVRFSEDDIEGWLEERRRGERLRPRSLKAIGGSR